MNRVDIDLAVFEEDLLLLATEYEDNLLEMIAEMGPRDTFEDLFAPCRDAVLPYYPTLEFCYKQHGYYHKCDINIQPETAKLGRRVAGMMWSIVDKHEAIAKAKEKEAQEFDHKPVPVGVRFYGMSEVEDYEETEKTTSSRAVRSEAMAEVLALIFPGQTQTWYYADISIAKLDQGLLKTACTIAGWYDTLKPGLRPYKSSIYFDAEKDRFCLTVWHLRTPRKEKESRK